MKIERMDIEIGCFIAKIIIFRKNGKFAVGRYIGTRSSIDIKTDWLHEITNSENLSQVRYAVQLTVISLQKYRSQTFIKVRSTGS